MSCVAAACLGFLVAVAACSCGDEPAKSPRPLRLPPAPRSMGDCIDRYDVGSPAFNGCVAKVCIDRYEGERREDKFLACVAKVQEWEKRHFAQAESPVRKAGAGAADDAGSD